MFSTVNQNLCLVILTASLILPLGAQEKIRVRFAAQVLPPDIRQLVMSSGELVSELKDGRRFTLKAGMGYQVSDHGDAAHRSVTEKGATLFIVD